MISVIHKDENIQDDNNEQSEQSVQDKQSTSRKLVTNTAWNTIGVLAYFACQWLITVIVVRLYGDYTNAGYLALAMNITNVFTTLATYNIRVFQVSDIKREYTDSVYVTARILTCVIAVLLCAAFVIIDDLTATQRIIIICYMVFRANEAFIDVLHGIDQKNWRMDYVGISFITRGIAMLSAFTLLGWLFGLLPAVIGMAVITTVIGVVYDISKTKKLVSFKINADKKIFSLLKQCFPLMLVILFATLIISFSRYSIERIHGTEDLGAYASVTVPTIIVQLAAGALLVLPANLFAESLKEGKKEKYIRTFAISSIAIVGITIVFLIGSHYLGHWGLNLLFGESILPYAYLLPGAALVAGLTAFMWFMNVAFAAVRDIKGLLAGNLIGVVICFALTNVFLINQGLAGANNIMILSQGVAVLCLFFRLIWFIKNKPELFSNR